MKHRPEPWPCPQQLSYAKVLADHLQKKWGQHFWGLASWHEESLGAPALLPRSSRQLQASSVLFTAIPDSFPVLNGHKIPSQLSMW